MLTAADVWGVTGGDGASPSGEKKEKEKTQPAVISKGDRLLINAMCSGSGSLPHYSSWQEAWSELRLCADR